MVDVTYHCPYCGAVTALEREGYLDDECVTREPLEGWEYAAATDDLEEREAADGIEFVCLGNADGGADTTDATVATRDGDRDGGATEPDPTKDGCGRTFYLSFVRYEDGDPVEHRQPDVDPPRFDFRK